MNKSVSIITPVLNAASYINETIGTVQNQTFVDWEWLIVDDGSTDDTIEIVLDAARRDSRICLIYPKGETGLAARARNRGMADAQGEFLALLDADDLWEPSKLARQVAYLREHNNVEGVACLYDLFGDETRVLNENGMQWSPADILCTRTELIENCPFQTSTVLFRRKCYDEIGGMDEDPRLSSTEDYEFFFRLVTLYTFHRIMEPLSHYRLLPPKVSYSGQTLDTVNRRGWQTFQVMAEKGLFTAREKRQKQSFLYYEQAKNNLFLIDAPFRRYLLKSVFAGRPPTKALIMLVLSFLPAPLLRPLLKSLLNAVNLVQAKRAGNSKR